MYRLNTLLLLIILASCQSASHTGDDKLDVNTWTQLDNDLLILNHPADWVLTESANAKMILMLKSPQSDTQDSFLENINILQHEFTLDSLDFDAYVKRQEDIILNKTNDGNLISSDRSERHDEPLHTIVYTGTAQGREYKFLQNLSMKDGVGYMATFTAETAQFAAYFDQAEQILKSVQLK